MNNLRQNIKQFILMILPSSKLGNDVNIQYNQCYTLKPLSMNELSLTLPMKQKILNSRKNNNTMEIIRDNKKLTLIIPFRNREEHLQEFLPAVKQRLSEQKIDYEIIIVEQDDQLFFNKAKLMNIATLHANSGSEYFVFHDVDSMPTNIDYRYSNQTIRLFNYIKRGENDFEEYPQTVFGGAILVPKKIFFDINGFSNKYWQWGKEDDDFLLRHLFKGYNPLFDTEGKITMLPHPFSLTLDNKGKVSTNKLILKQNWKLSNINKKIFSRFKRGITSQDNDGINNVKDYIITSTTFKDRVKTIKVQFKI